MADKGTVITDLNFYIRDGIMDFDSYFISLDAIAFVKLETTKEAGPLRHNKKGSSLIIQTNTGQTFLLRHKNSDFLSELMQILKAHRRDRSVYYHVDIEKGTICNGSAQAAEGGFSTNETLSASAPVINNIPVEEPLPSIYHPEGKPMSAVSRFGGTSPNIGKNRPTPGVKPPATANKPPRYFSASAYVRNHGIIPEQDTSSASRPAPQPASNKIPAKKVPLPVQPQHLRQNPPDRSVMMPQTGTGKGAYAKQEELPVRSVSMPQTGTGKGAYTKQEKLPVRSVSMPQTGTGKGAYTKQEKPPAKAAAQPKVTNADPLKQALSSVTPIAPPVKKGKSSYMRQKEEIAAAKAGLKHTTGASDPLSIQKISSTSKILDLGPAKSNRTIPKVEFAPEEDTVSLSKKDWTDIEYLFFQRKSSFTSSDPRFQACETLEEFAFHHDRYGMRKFFKSLPKEQLRGILADYSKENMALLSRIIH